jgi:hypothetical protein
MTVPPPQARRHPRFSVDVEAVVHTAGGEAFSARTRDLSRSGICLITTRALVVNEPLLIELVLAFGDDAFSEPLRLESRVVWSTPIGTAFQVGAMFEELDVEAVEFLEMFLRYLDGSMVPHGQPVDDSDDRDDTPPPDIKDDPFRS